MGVRDFEEFLRYYIPKEKDKCWVDSNQLSHQIVKIGLD